MNQRYPKGSEYWRKRRLRYAAIGFGLIAFALLCYVVFVIVGAQIGQTALMYFGAALCFASLLASAVMAGFVRYAHWRLREERFYEQQVQRKGQINNGAIGYGTTPKEESEREENK